MDKKIAIAFKESAPISTKVSVEISSHLRGRETEKAKNILKKTVNMKEAIPFKRYNKDIAHKRGNMAAGKFPINASKHFLRLIEEVESNAKQHGLVSPFKITHLSAHKASKTWHYGRFRRRTAKRTNVKIEIQEMKKKENKTKEKKVENKK